MDNEISWIATAFTVTAAMMTASNLGSRITGYGFAVFTLGSLAWIVTGVMTSQPALVWTNAILTGLNLFGVWRWLGRQARIDEGGRSAQEQSRDTPGEALFPASLLGKAKLTGVGDEQLGASVDAMIGCASGRIHYLVISEGGLVGVGETLRRVGWHELAVYGDELRTRLDRSAFESLRSLAKDDWPG
jgi:hypothetical protein